MADRLSVTIKLVVLTGEDRHHDALLWNYENLLVAIAHRFNDRIALWVSRMPPLVPVAIGATIAPNRRISSTWRSIERFTHS
jgi:hypothetical protein